MKKNTIVVKDKLLSGSITTAMAKCGNLTCKCQKSKKDWHGPYYRWTGIFNGKRTTITLSKEIARECEIRIRNYQNLKDQLQKILLEEMNNPPWNTP